MYRDNRVRYRRDSVLPLLQMKFHLYRDRKKEWRWKLIKNGRVIADSGEGYKRKGACKRMIEKIIMGADGATIEEP